MAALQHDGSGRMPIEQQHDPRPDIDPAILSSLVETVLNDPTADLAYI